MNYIKNMKLSFFSVILAAILYVLSGYKLLNFFVFIIMMLILIRGLTFYGDYKRACKLTIDNNIYIAKQKFCALSVFRSGIIFKTMSDGLISLNTTKEVSLTLSDKEFNELEYGNNIIVVINNIKYNLKKAID